MRTHNRQTPFVFSIVGFLFSVSNLEAERATNPEWERQNTWNEGTMGPGTSVFRSVRLHRCIPLYLDRGLSSLEQRCS